MLGDLQVVKESPGMFCLTTFHSGSLFRGGAGSEMARGWSVAGGPGGAGMVRCGGGGGELSMEKPVLMSK